jgi:uncharacterized protein YidB (DUF937 family)
MGLFDNISGMIGQLLSGGGGTSLVTGQVMEVLQQHGINGVPGLVAQFEQAGLGTQAASWVGNGENLPVSGADIESALGGPVLASIAERFGIDPEQAKQLIAQHLPNVVDQQTPDGALPQQ